MKRFVCGMCCCWLAGAMGAEPAQTFDGWSLGTGVRYASIDGNHPLMPGLTAHVHLHGGARLGVEYWRTVQDVSLHYGVASQLGGSFVRVYEADDNIHLYNELFVGAGSLHRKANLFSQYDEVTDRFMVFEPGLGLEMAMTEHWSVQAGMRYRWVTRVDILGTDEKDLSGLSLQLMLRWTPGRQQGKQATSYEFDPMQPWPVDGQ